MNKTKEVYAMDRYKEYETRSVNPQECNPAPTITIAHHKVTMEDMFKRPEYVSELKYLQGLLDEVNNQVVDLLTQGRKPTAVLMNHKAYKVIREHAGGVKEYSLEEFNKQYLNNWTINAEFIKTCGECEYFGPDGCATSRLESKYGTTTTPACKDFKEIDESKTNRS